MFILKKIIGGLLQPLPLVLLSLLVGLLLLWFGRRRHAGRGWVTLGALILLLSSIGPVVDLVRLPLEQRHAVYAPDAGPVPTHVVVLSGGHFNNPDLPFSSRLTGDALNRLVEGIRIHRLHPGSRLLLSGGSVFTADSEASIMAALARELGVPGDRILLEDHSRDTRDQAVFVLEMIGRTPMVLVTSAIHMPRAMALFRGVGLDPIPAPTAHKVSQPGVGNAISAIGRPLPEGLGRVGEALHEYLGIAWAWLRGQV